MKRLLFLSLFLFAAPVNAGVVHKITATAQASVDAVSYTHLRAHET